MYIDCNMKTKITNSAKCLCAALSFITYNLSFGVALTSCRFEDEDYFEEPAAQRIETTTENIKKTLVGAENGWVMQYFTGTDDIEGFNLLVRFENNNKVTFASDHRYLRDGNAGVYTERASLYELLKEDGPVLAFNVWNDVLTPFVDPVDYTLAPGMLIKDGEGMAGDHNFVVLSCSSDEVMLRGERHSARVRLIPCKSSWQEYINKTNELKNYITNTTVTNYYVINGLDTLYFKNLRAGHFTYCERINDPLFPTTINCVFTTEGFRLHHENDIKGTTFQEFHIDADSTCLVSENDSVRVIACWDNYIVNARSTVWNFDQETLSDTQRALLSQIADEFKKYNKSYDLASVGLGRSTGKNAVKGLVFTFYTNTAKTKTNTAGLEFTTIRPKFGLMQIAVSSEDNIDGNMTAIAGKSDIEALARQFAATLEGTYKMTPNNHFLPTGAEFTPADGGNSFKLGN